MPSVGVSKLVPPPTGYCVDVSSPNFETLAYVLDEDATRTKLLAKYQKLESPSIGYTLTYAPGHARRLKRFLKKAVDKRKRKSLASSVDMREFRIRVCGHVKLLRDTTLEYDPMPFHVMIDDWHVPASDLCLIDPRKLKAEFLADLNRAGGDNANGYLIMFLHAEFDPVRFIYKLHFHGMVGGNMKQVIHHLKTLKKYVTTKPDPASIVVRKAPLHDDWTALSYLLKSFWPSRYSGPVADKGVMRPRKGRRIPEPYHSEYLMWLHQWRLEDITLLKNLRVGAGGNGLIPTKL